MTYAEVTTSESNLYLIDRDLVDQVIHHSAYIQSINENAKLTTEKEGFGMPETYEYDIDIDTGSVGSRLGRRGRYCEVGPVGDLCQDVFYPQSRLPTRLDVESLRHRLISTEKAGQDANDAYLAKMQNATHSSMKNINDRASTFETAANVATITRNLSTDFILITAGTLTGGAALAVGGAGSLFKGVRISQHTHNVGAAVLHAQLQLYFGNDTEPKRCGGCMGEASVNVDEGQDYRCRDLFCRTCRGQKPEGVCIVSRSRCGVRQGYRAKRLLSCSKVKWLKKRSHAELKKCSERKLQKSMSEFEMEELLKKAVGNTVIPVGVAIRLAGSRPPNSRRNIGADKGVEKFVELGKSRGGGNHRPGDRRFRGEPPVAGSCRHTRSGHVQLAHLMSVVFRAEDRATRRFLRPRAKSIDGSAE